MAQTLALPFLATLLFFLTMNERRLTCQALLQANLDQYSGEIQGKVYQESPNEQGCLGVTAHPGVILRLICSAVDVADGPAELLVQLMLRFGLILSFFQAFRLAIEGAACCQQSRAVEVPCCTAK